jgi:hypothetical protein
MNQLSQQNLSTLRETLDGLGYAPATFEGGLGFVLNISDKMYEGAIVHLLADSAQIIFYLEFRERPVQSTFLQVMEFVARANWGMLIGNYEMNLDDGSVCIKSSIDYSDALLTPDQIKNLVMAAIKSGEMYGTAFIRVCRGEVSAKDAIAEVENDT